MVEEKTEVEVDVRVRPLLGHWKPVGCLRKQKEYKKHLSSNGGLDSSVWKASKKEDGCLTVSASQCFEYTHEKEERQNKKPNSLQCLWEASENHRKAPVTSDTTSSYQNPSKLTFSETESNSSGSNFTIPDKGRIQKETVIEEKQIKDTLQVPDATPLVVAEEKKDEVPEKKSEDTTKTGSEEVNVALPDTKNEVTISEWKCWLLLALFIAIMVVYRNQMIAEMLED